MSASTTAEELSPFSALDRTLGRSLLRISEVESPTLETLISLLSHQVQLGHSYISLSRLKDGKALLDEIDKSGLSDDKPNAPLVVDDNDRLYFSKHWRYEQEIAAKVVQRILSSKPEIADTNTISQAIERLLPFANSAEQKDAALGVLNNTMSIITGGPGTGKTATVLSAVALILENATALGSTTPSIALLAPTGKAAHRLSQSIRSSVDNLEISDALRTMLPTAASTVHRALSSSRTLSTNVDLVVIDEASMVDLALMHRTLMYFENAKRIVLLGDTDQLASVEAGSILLDLSNAQHQSTHVLPVFTLGRSHRYEHEGSLDLFANAIRDQHVDKAISLLESNDHPQITMLEDRREALGLATDRNIAMLKSNDPAALLASRSSFQILCAPKRGPVGFESINDQIERRLRSMHAIPNAVTDYNGRPFVLTANDHELEVYNGDIGVIAIDETSGMSRAYLESGDSDVRRIALSRLPARQTAYALSVHKSQGSEYDEVMVYLPRSDSPLLCRELLYTAVSRARTKVTIVGSSDQISIAINQRSARASGLGRAISKAMAISVDGGGRS